MGKLILSTIVALMTFASTVAAQELRMENYMASISIHENFVEEIITFTIVNNADNTLNTTRKLTRLANIFSIVFMRFTEFFIVYEGA